jgi:hypothetical protein
MAPNLYEQYEQVIGYIYGYVTFDKRVIQTASLGPLGFGLFRPRVFRLLTKTASQGAQRDELSAKSTAARSEFYQQFTPVADQASEYFQVATSEYPDDALSAGLLRAFPHYDFEVLAKIHELRKERLLRYGPKTLFGASLSVLAVLLKSIPEVVVERDFGVTYVEFERGVFLFIAAITVYVSIVLVPVWLGRWLASDKREHAGQILRYTALKAKLKPTPVDEGVDVGSRTTPVA